MGQDYCICFSVSGFWHEVAGRDQFETLQEKKGEACTAADCCKKVLSVVGKF